MQLVYSTDCANLYLHTGPHNALELQWLDFVNSDTLRACLLEAMRQARRYTIRAWVADNRLSRAIRAKDFEWMDEHVMQPFNQMGMHRLALIESEDAMNRMGINSFLSSIIPGTSIVTKTFASVEEARAWAMQPY